MARWLDPDRPDDLVVARRPGRQHALSELRREVMTLHSLVASRPARRWLLQFDDSWHFLIAFLAVLHAGGTPVITGGWPLVALRERRALFDDVLTDDETLAATFQGVLTTEARPPAGVHELPRIRPDTPIEMFTSGSTGEPSCCRLTPRILDLELEQLGALYGERIAGCCVTASVSHQHRYGLLWRILTPMTLGLSLDALSVRHPGQLAARTQAGPIIFVTSPAFLKRIGDDPELADIHLIMSAGGAFPNAVARHLADDIGVAPHELYGSTETGFIAWRRNRGDEPLWHPTDDMQLFRQDDYWWVKSPRISNPAGERLGDVLEMHADGFRLLGRRDRIVKIEDERVSLDEVERRVRELVPGSDPHGVVLTRNGRQSLGMVLRMQPEDMLALQGHALVERQRAWRQQLRQWLEPLAIPRYWRVTDQLPADSLGKHSQLALRTLFDASPE